MKKFIVYKYTNLHNGLIYIGITSQGLEKRWKDGYRSNKRLQYAIDKYGKKNFKREILYSNLTKEEACQLEIETIALLNTTNPRIGYNISIGGTAPMYNRKHTKETREKLSMLNKKENNGFYGKHHDRHNMPNNIKIICLNNNKIFDSISLASEYMINIGCVNCTWQNIQNAINENQMYAGKTKDGELLFWSKYDESKPMSYYKELFDKKKEKKANYTLPFKNKVVDIINNIIYDGAKEAAEIIGCHHSKITSCCNGIRATCCGTIFLYEKDYIALSQEEKFEIIMERWDKSRGNPIVCLNTGKIYKNQKEATQDVHLKYSDGILKYLKGESEYAGIGENNEFLKWAKYEDYVKMDGKEISKIIDKPVLNHTPLHCITTNKYFRDASTAAKYYNLHISGLHKCCRGEYQTCGIYNGQKLKWEYDTQYRWNLYCTEDDIKTLYDTKGLPLENIFVNEEESEDEE